MDPPGGSLHGEHIVIEVEDDDNEDAELQRVLVLSLEQHHQQSSPSSYLKARTTSYSSQDEDEDLKAALALSMHNNNNNSSTSPPSMVVTTTSFYPPDQADEDAALQAALALSLQDSGRSGDSSSSAQQQPQRQHPAAAANSSLSARAAWQQPYDDDDDDDDDQKPAARETIRTAQTNGAVAVAAAVGGATTTTPTTFSAQAAQPLPLLQAAAVEECYREAQPYDLHNFHEIMWDTTLTTESDQMRWVQQGINVRESTATTTENAVVEEETSATMSATASSSDTNLTSATGSSDTNTTCATGGSPSLETSAASATGSPDPDTLNMTTTARISAMNELTRLEQLAANHLPWGLVQSHGGPCGVLAAVQAELLRHLIWGGASWTGVVSRNAWLEALARSIGTILARAALAESSTPPSGEAAAAASSSSATTTAPSTIDRPVVLVLPREGRPISLEDLFSATTLSNANPLMLQYTLSRTLLSVQEEDRTAKRQKTDDMDDATTDHEKRLAETVAAFLLQSSPVAAADDANHSRPPIHQFRHAGGVVLLVMSLLATRTGLRDDFDDPFGTKLTAQFGHCSQELINLLLTGQATSNVFDYSLRPSGDMLCRGISSRPAVGYLSQLESMRYCQVGSFYKSSKFPIFVVGSTSHFTVLWGPRSCLFESQSDVLLEECRRAFKSVEGGEENGFVAANRLGEVLKQLENHVQLDEAQVSLMAAALEVNGAGIILWEDFWKTTSRLSTGAILESVLAAQGSNAASAQPQDAMIVATTTTTAAITTKTPETDEDVARRLASEWGWEDASSIGAVNGGSSVTLPSDAEEELSSDTMLTEDWKTPPAAGAPLHFERLGRKFVMYHYNGLRGGILTAFRVARLSPEEAVGASIALNRGGSHSGGSHSSADLEDVVRTKWPSCTVSWQGGQAPYID